MKNFIRLSLILFLIINFSLLPYSEEDDIFDIDTDITVEKNTTKSTENKSNNKNIQKPESEQSQYQEDEEDNAESEETDNDAGLMNTMILNSIKSGMGNIQNTAIKIKDAEYRLDMKSNNLTKVNNTPYWTITDWHSLLLGLSGSYSKSIDIYLQLAIFADKPASAEMNGKPYWYGTKNFGVYVIDKNTGEYKRPYTGLEKLRDDEILGINSHDMETAGLYDTDTVGIFIKKADANIRTEYFDAHIFKNIGHKGWNDELFGLYWDNWLTEEYFQQGHLAPEGVQFKGKKFLSPFTIVMGEEPLFGEDPFILSRISIPINFINLTFYHREILTDMKAKEGVIYLIPNVSRADYNNKVFIAIPASTNKTKGIFDADNRITAFKAEYKIKEFIISGEVAKYKPAEKSLAYAGRLKTDLFSLLGIEAKYLHNDIYAGNRNEFDLSLHLRPIKDILFMVDYKNIKPVSGEVEFLFPPMILDSDALTWLNNRERSIIEISLVYDTTPSTWIKSWNINDTETGDFAGIITYKYFKYPTYTDYQEHFDYEWRLWWQEKHQDTIEGKSVYTYGKYPYTGNQFSAKVIANIFRPIKIIEDFNTGLKEAGVGSRYALTPFTINYTSNTEIHYKNIIFTFLFAKDDWGPVFGSAEWGIKYDTRIRTSLRYKIGKSFIELYYDEGVNNNESNDDKIAAVSPDTSYKEIGTVFTLKF